MVTPEETDPSRRGRCVQAPKPGQGQGLLPWRYSKASLVGLAQVQCRVPEPPSITLMSLQDSDLMQRTCPEGFNLLANPSAMTSGASATSEGLQQRRGLSGQSLLSAHGPPDHCGAELDRLCPGLGVG